MTALARAMRLLCAVLVVGLGGPSAEIRAQDAPAAGEELPADAKLVSDPKALAALLADRTVHAAYASDGEPWREFSASDGRTIWEAHGCIRPGTWQISGSVVCYVYPTWDEGRPQCFLVYQSAKAVHFVGFEPGTLSRYLVSSTQEILDGNPDGLPLDATQPICGDPNV